MSVNYSVILTRAASIFGARSFWKILAFLLKGTNHGATFLLIAYVSYSALTGDTETVRRLLESLNDLLQ